MKIATLLLATHCQVQHGFVKGDLVDPPPPPPKEFQTHWISFARAAREVAGSMEGFLGRVSSRTNLRVHFVRRNMWDTIRVLEEGNRPHPCCPRCDMFLPWWYMNGIHPSVVMCARGAESKIRRLVEEETHMGAVTAFQDYGRPLASVSEFKYVGRVLTASDDYWPSAVANLRKACQKWDQVSRILGWEGSDAMTLCTFYKAVVQALLLSGLETWVTTPWIG